MANGNGDPRSQEPSQLKDGISGTCLCGSITVTIHDSELFTRRRGHLCHCANCRKVAGSYVSSNLNIEEEKVEIQDRDHTLTKYTDTATGTGLPVYRYFCSWCGSPIQSVPTILPGRRVVKMGIFPRIPAPEFETFAQYRQDWQGHHSGMEMYKLTPRGEKL